MTHRYAAANRLLEDDRFTYTYDLNGNRTEKREKTTGATTTFTYDPEDQLIRADLPGGKFSEYKYDGLGRRIEKNVNGTITRTVYDNEDIVLEYTVRGEPVEPLTPSAHWVHGPGIDEPLMMERDLNSNGIFEDTERFFYHADGLGSIVALTNNTGQVVERYRYDSFGQPTITGPGPDNQMDTPDDVILTESAYGNPYLFTAREWDPETGLYFYRARYLDPRTGTFLQEDRIAGFLFNPKSLNRYPCVENNPVNFTDPFGDTAVVIGAEFGAPFGPIGIIIGVGIGIVITIAAGSYIIQARQRTRFPEPLPVYYPGPHNFGKVPCPGEIRPPPSHKPPGWRWGAISLAAAELAHKWNEFLEGLKNTASTIREVLLPDQPVITNRRK